MLGVRVLGGLRGQAGVGSVMRMWVAYRGLGAGGDLRGAARGAVFRGRVLVSTRLEEKKHHKHNIIYIVNYVFKSWTLQQVLY